MFGRVRRATVISLMIAILVWNMPEAVKAVPVELAEAVEAMDIDDSRSSIQALHEYASGRKVKGGKRLRDDEDDIDDDGSMLHELRETFDARIKRAKDQGERFDALSILPTERTLQDGAETAGHLNLRYVVLDWQLRSLEPDFNSLAGLLKEIRLAHWGPDQVLFTMESELENWKVTGARLSNLLDEVATVKTVPLTAAKERSRIASTFELKKCFQEMFLIKGVEHQLDSNIASHVNYYRLRLNLKLTMESFMFMLIPDLHDLSKINEPWFHVPYGWLIESKTMDRVASHIHEIYGRDERLKLEPTMNFLLRADETNHLHPYLKALPNEAQSFMIHRLEQYSSLD